MSGVAVIRSLLAGNSPVLAVIPATRIMAGELPLNIVLPAISVTQISSVPLNFIRTNEANKMHIDRVQVSTIFKGTTGGGTGYAGMKAMMVLILAACPSQRGTVNTVSVDSIQPDFSGPDLYDDVTDTHQGSRDFIVKWIGA